MAKDLPVSEISLRLKAGRALRDMNADDLQERITQVPHELKKEPLKKAERADPKAPLPGAYRNAVAQILKLPRDWFFAPLEQLLPLESGARRYFFAPLPADSVSLRINSSIVGRAVGGRAGGSGRSVAGWARAARSRIRSGVG